MTSALYKINYLKRTVHWLESHEEESQSTRWILFASRVGARASRSTATRQIIDDIHPQKKAVQRKDSTPRPHRPQGRIKREALEIKKKVNRKILRKKLHHGSAPPLASHRSRLKRRKKKKKKPSRRERQRRSSKRARVADSVGRRGQLLVGRRGLAPENSSGKVPPPVAHPRRRS